MDDGRRATRVGLIIMLAVMAVAASVIYTRKWRAESGAKREERADRAAQIETSNARSAAATTAMVAAAQALTPEAVSRAAEVDARAVIAAIRSADPSIRGNAELRINGLGGEAQPLLEAAAAAAGSDAATQARLREALTYVAPRARRLREAAVLREWLRQHLQAEYSAHGQTSPTWDADVRRGIDLMMRLSRDPLVAHPLEGTTATASDAFQAAFANGCTDPLVPWLGRLTEATPSGRGWRGVSLAGQADKVEASAYSPLVRFWVALLTPRSRPVGKKPALSPAAKLLPAIAAIPGIPAGLLPTCGRGLMTSIIWEGPEGRKSWRELADAYAAAAPGSATALTLRGQVLIDAAWFARGNGQAELVQPEQWAEFNQRLAEAEAALTAAWNADPSDPTAAAMMITVKMGQGEAGGGRKAMETWFARAMAADPDCLDACGRKLRYLGPEWHGSLDEMVAFGRECLKTRNWHGGVALLAATVHENIASGLGTRYLEGPEVWDDISKAYEGGLANAPSDALLRSQYARVAANSQKWDVAHRELTTLGPRAVAHVFGGQDKLNALRAKVARMAGRAEMPPRGLGGRVVVAGGIGSIGG